MTGRGFIAHRVLVRPRIDTTSLVSTRPGVERVAFLNYNELSKIIQVNTISKLLVKRVWIKKGNVICTFSWNYIYIYIYFLDQCSSLLLKRRIFFVDSLSEKIRTPLWTIRSNLSSLTSLIPRIFQLPVLTVYNTSMYVSGCRKGEDVRRPWELES